MREIGKLAEGAEFVGYHELKQYHGQVQVFRLSDGRHYQAVYQNDRIRIVGNPKPHESDAVVNVDVIIEEQRIKDIPPRELLPRQKSHTQIFRRPGT